MPGDPQMTLKSSSFSIEAENHAPREKYVGYISGPLNVADKTLPYPGPLIECIQDPYTKFMKCQKE